MPSVLSRLWALSLAVIVQIAIFQIQRSHAQEIGVGAQSSHGVLPGSAVDESVAGEPLSVVDDALDSVRVAHHHARLGESSSAAHREPWVEGLSAGRRAPDAPFKPPRA
jgi:hypothetical protein